MPILALHNGQEKGYELLGRGSRLATDLSATADTVADCLELNVIAQEVISHTQQNAFT